MEYTYTTTKEMDAALAAESKNQKTTAEALFNTIITADMGTLVSNHASRAKEDLKTLYDLIKDKDKEDIDKILDKYKPKS